MIRGSGAICQMPTALIGNSIPSFVRIAMLMPHPLFVEALQLASTLSIWPI
jgi:hypothetical protein